MRSRSVSTEPAIASSIVAPQMNICSLAASNDSASSGSRHTAQPTRRPGRPYAFDIELTLIARGERVAAIGSCEPCVRSRYVSSTNNTEPDRSANSTSACNVVEIEHRAGRVVRARDRYQLGHAGAYARREPLDIELPAVVEREVDDVELRADRARGLEVRRVVGAYDDRMITRFEQRRRGREQRGRRPRHHQDVVGVQAGAARRDRLAEHGITEVIPVAKQEVVERECRRDRRAGDRQPSSPRGCS